MLTKFYTGRDRGEVIPPPHTHRHTDTDTHAHTHTHADTHAPLNKPLKSPRRLGLMVWKVEYFQMEDRHKEKDVQVF